MCPNRARFEYPVPVRGSSFVGLIDWDHARPAQPLFDTAYALEYAAPFRDDEECLRRLRYTSLPNRRRRICRASVDHSSAIASSTGTRPARRAGRSPAAIPTTTATAT
jgi:aminoglycoside phosphotransferase (APT) family kinase protein